MICACGSAPAGEAGHVCLKCEMKSEVVPGHGVRVTHVPGSARLPLVAIAVQAPDPDDVFGALSCGRPDVEVCPCSRREQNQCRRATHETEGEFFRIPWCVY